MLKHTEVSGSPRWRAPTACLVSWALLLAAGLHATPAAAQEQTSVERVSLDPAAPQSVALPGGTAPTFGVPPSKPSDYRFDFHGILIAPLRAGLNTRENREPGQSKTVLHAPPVVPDDLETFSHTGVVPTPYTQLNFSYGNSVATGTVSLVAKVPSVSAGFLDPSAQLGINDAFGSIRIPDLGPVRLKLHVGAFSNRYGAMGEYDEGRYGTPLIARINGVGETIQALVDAGDFTVLLEQGIQGSSNSTSRGITPDGWNGWADQRAGASFVTHFHGGLSYRGIATLAGHYFSAFSRDERSNPSNPDGSIDIVAADLRLELGRFGHFYAGYAHTNSEYGTAIGRLVEVLNAPGGAGLEQNYFGSVSNGNGQLDTFGAQYDLSIGRLVSYPVAFAPDGPDVVVSLFGIATQVTSDDARFDGLSRRKLGVEASYSLLPWFAASARYDRVDPDVDDTKYSFAVLSPRLIFRTDWNAHDQVVLQYSHWFNGSLTTVRSGYPPRDDVSVVPDEDVISLSANMWW